MASTPDLTAHASPAFEATVVDELSHAWRIAREALQQAAEPTGFWTGALSTSALSTATAISAMAVARQHYCIPDQRSSDVEAAIRDGCQWLVVHQNSDGGFGDTDRSHSNIATTLLVLAAWELAGKIDDGFRQQVAQPTRQAWQYVDAAGRWEGLRQRYGKDKTFVVPILSNCALAGLVDWRDVAALPFEAAWLPQELYRWARMPVVSYAVPALVAIGQARFHRCPPRSRWLRSLRRRALQPTLAVLRRMQPSSGGYLEAVPLTSFVLMNLAAVGNGSLPVAQDCLRFILDSRLDDGSWPIDTNLATWLTSLSIHALGRRGRLQVTSAPTQVREGNRGGSRVADDSRQCLEGGSLETPAISSQLLRWVLSCQHTQRHPFTGATPGGWGWTNLSGAVPDADDTPAALLALSGCELSDPSWGRLQHQVLVAAGRGLTWLVRLQNRDGGWPTFCRGWGKLPFDRSGTDLTAHALRAIHAWLPHLDTIGRSQSGTPSVGQLQRASRRGLAYLQRCQRADGSWVPLWFGNQDRPLEDNPIYGTGKVLLAYAALGNPNCREAQRGREYLRNSQNRDGGWGGGASLPSFFSEFSAGRGPALAPAVRSSLEETAIALEGLLECGGDPRQDATIMLGLEWLSRAVQRQGINHATPIGFYFAKLWYYEQLYPTVFSLSALGTALRKLHQADCQPTA